MINYRQAAWVLWTLDRLTVVREEGKVIEQYFSDEKGKLGVKSISEYYDANIQDLKEVKQKSNNI